jgi:hypothetical protein
MVLFSYCSNRQSSTPDPTRVSFFWLSASNPTVPMFPLPTFWKYSIQKNCLEIQGDRLHASKDTSEISFSIETDAASVFFQGNVPYTQIEGFISTEKQMYKTAVQDWLGHIDIVNLKLTAVWHWRTPEQIKKFLAASKLADDGNDPGDHRGLRLRVDLCEASTAPKSCRGGRPRRSDPGSKQLPPSCASAESN